MNLTKLSFFELNNETFEKYIDALIRSSRESRENSGSDTKEWFRSKFLCSPLGEGLNLLAYDDSCDRVVGFVAFGRYDFKSEYKNLVIYEPYDVFVNPDYRGKAIFKKLLVKCEELLRQRGADLMLNFPNSNSYRGFISNKFEDFASDLSYYIKPITLNFFIKLVEIGRAHV